MTQLCDISKKSVLITGWLVAPQCSPELGTLLYSGGSEVRLVLLVRHDGFVVFIPSLFVPIIHFAPKNYLNYKKGFKNIFFSHRRLFG